MSSFIFLNIIFIDCENLCGAPLVYSSTWFFVQQINRHIFLVDDRAKWELQNRNSCVLPRFGCSHRLFEKVASCFLKRWSLAVNLLRGSSSSVSFERQTFVDVFTNILMDVRLLCNVEEYEATTSYLA